MTLREFIEITNYNKFKVAKENENGIMETLIEFDRDKICSKYISDVLLGKELDIALFSMDEENENILEYVILLIKE